MRVVLTTDTQGDTWFDDCRISCPRSDTKTVTLHLDSKHIITDHWQGFGFSGDIFPFAPGMTDADRRLIRERVRIMRPQLVRVYCAVADWEAEYGKRTPDTEGMRRLCETLDIYKQAGADIQLHEWGYTFPEWCRAKERTIHPEERRHFTDSFADMVKYLRDDRGFSNIKYVTIYNEPNWGGVSWEDYAAVYRSLDASLKSAGLREQVAVLGPDEANERKWLPKAVSELNDAMDCYEVHNYTCDTGSEFGSFIGVRVLDLPASRSKTMVPPRKRLVISEFGMCDGMSTWENPNVNSYKYGMFLADSAIAAANAGVSGMLVWCLMDVDFGGDLKWGLWKSKSEGWEPRPGYYAWSLITRYTERDSMVYPLQSDAEGVDAVAFHAPVKGSWTLLAVNRQTDARPFRILGLPAASKWQPFIYCKESVPALDRKMIPSSKLIRADRSRNLTGVLPGNSFVLWHETK
ncbi:MAG TPA: hypothetical protein VHV83_15370 [Armatimonadota bacterium]|nr:hypothetical protein [Armatimonadota bacterium]